jgi:hypothetical protein
MAADDQPPDESPFSFRDLRFAICVSPREPALL